MMLVAVEPVEIDGDEIGGCADREFAGARRAGCPAAVADREAEEFRAGPGALEAEPAMYALHQPHLAQGIVVLIQRQAVDPDRDAHNRNCGRRRSARGRSADAYWS